MKTTQNVCALSAWLALVNIGAIIAGFAVYVVLGRTHQLSIQIPVASVGTIAAFAISVWAIRSHVGEFGRSMRAALGVYVLAFVWAPAIFVPLHLVTQGYVTGWRNIVALMLFQLPVNLLAVVFAYAEPLRNPNSRRIAAIHCPHDPIPQVHPTGVHASDIGSGYEQA